MPYPQWLPAMFQMSPWSVELIEELYDIFKTDFVENRANYDGYNVWFFPEMDNGKEEIFWHLIEKDGNATEGRVADFRRSERLPWARPALDNISENEVIHWDYEEGGGKGIRTYVWLKDYEYVIIMKKYPDNQRRLVTAHCVDYSNTRRKLQKKYESRI